MPCVKNKDYTYLPLINLPTYKIQCTLMLKESFILILSPFISGSKG